MHCEIARIIITTACTLIKAADGLKSYKRAFNSEFYDHHQSCKHIADVALQESLNNVLERMQGSIREREKIMRGLKVDDIPNYPHEQDLL
jgi:hypothetical protein